MPTGNLGACAFPSHYNSYSAMASTHHLSVLLQEHVFLHVRSNILDEVCKALSPVPGTQ